MTQEKGDRKFACILAFDVTVNKEARELAESMGVRIFSADIIYHLFDQFTAYLKQVGPATSASQAQNLRLSAQSSGPQLLNFECTEDTIYIALLPNTLRCEALPFQHTLCGRTPAVMPTADGANCGQCR